MSIRIFRRSFQLPNSRYRPNILQSTQILCFSRSTALCHEKRTSNGLFGRRLLRVRAYNTGIKVYFLAGLHRLGSRAANIRYYLVEFDFQSCRAASRPCQDILAAFFTPRRDRNREMADGFKPVVDAYDCKTYRVTYLSYEIETYFQTTYLLFKSCQIY